MRSNWSISLPSCSAIGSSGRPSASSSSTIACLRLAAFQRFRKSSRLAKRFFSAFLVKSRRDFCHELAVLVEIFHAFGDNGGADAIDIDLALRPTARRQGQARLIDDGLVRAGLGAVSRRPRRWAARRRAARRGRLRPARKSAPARRRSPGRRNDWWHRESRSK